MSDILGISDLRTIHEEEEEEEAYRRNSQMSQLQVLEAQGRMHGSGNGHRPANGAGSFDGQIDPELLDGEHDARRGFPRVSISMTPQRHLGGSETISSYEDQQRNGSYDHSDLSRLIRTPNNHGQNGHANGMGHGHSNTGTGSSALWQHATTTLAGMERDGSESLYQEHEMDEDEEYEHEASGGGRRKSGARRSMGEEGSGEDMSGAEGGRKRVKVDTKTCDNCRKRKVSGRHLVAVL